MKPNTSCTVIATLLVMAPAAAHAATATSQTASIGLSSTRDKGIVSLMIDPVLSDGRLVFKIAAHNPTAEPVELRASEVKVFTAAGTPVSLLSVDELIADVTGGRSGDSNRSARGHDPANYSGPTVSQTPSGQPDVSNYTGGPVSGVVSSHTDTRTATAQRSPGAQDQAQIDAIQAAILQTAIVAPGQATGGQLVTRKIKFSRKEQKVLRVVIGFNGEQHEFDFEAPPAK